MRNTRRAFALCVALVVSGCVVSPERKVAAAKSALESAPVCCTSIGLARALPLPMEKKEVEIDAKASVMQFETGKSYFLLYQLPNYYKPYSIYFSSDAEVGRDALSLFVPRIALYDEDFKPTRHFLEGGLRNRGFNAEQTVFINPSNANERYLAIYNAPLDASIRRSVQTIVNTPVTVGMTTFNWASGKDSTLSILPSPMGKIEIEVLGLEQK